MLSMHRLAFVALAAVALSAAPHRAGADAAEVDVTGWVHYYDGGLWIGAESDPQGWVVSTSRRPADDFDMKIAYLDGVDAGIRFAQFDDQFVTLHGFLVKDAVSGGGIETGIRTFDVLKVTSVGMQDPMPVLGYRRAPVLERRILADLERRGVDFGRDGTDTPSRPLTYDGRINGRRFARIVPLAIPPEGSADMYTDLAFVDARRHRYWARRTGGFMAVNQWVGPFRVPRRMPPAARVTLVQVVGLSGR